MTIEQMTGKVDVKTPARFWIDPTVNVSRRCCANCPAQMRKACDSAPLTRSLLTPVSRLSTSPVMTPRIAYSRRW